MDVKGTVRGPVYIVGDHIDTDQIIPAEYLNLVPTIPGEYEALGSHALSGMPSPEIPFIEEGQKKTRYPIILAGKNFGCGSSREHAPIALGAAGVGAVVAESFARIFFRNCLATGEIYPLDSALSIRSKFAPGDEAEIDLAEMKIVNLRTAEAFDLNPLGDALPVVEAGGIFNYAREVGMI